MPDMPAVYDGSSVENPGSGAGGATTPATPANGASTAPAAGLAETTSTAPATAPEIQPERADATMTPAERSIKADNWGTKVYHGVLNALGGGGDVAYSRDPKTGKMSATPVATGPGTQWKRIIAGALTGFAASAQAGGTGPGSGLRAAGAGVGAGLKMGMGRDQQAREHADEDYQAAQKAATDQAQLALLSHQVAKSSFDLGREQVNAAVEDSERESNFGKVIGDGGAGSTDMGVFPDFQSVIKAFKEAPELHDHQAGGRIIAIPHINGKGQVDGIHAALVTPDWLTSKINRDLPITVRNYKDGKLEEQTFTVPAGSLTGQQYSSMVMAQSKDSLEDWKAQVTEKRADKTETREESRTKAENTQSYADANKLKADANKLNAEAKWDESDEAAANAQGGGGSLVDMIGTGKMPVGRMGYLLARKPEVLAAVARKYPDFDASKIDAYSHIYKDFTSGKVGEQLNAGDAALRHMNELKALNTSSSHNPLTAAYTSYQNKAHTVAVELAKFYGNPTIPAIEKIESTLLTQLPGKRDAAILTQAKSMSDKFDEFHQQWTNAAPSAAYEARMPQMSPEAMAARENLDPDYKAQRVEEQRTGTGAAPSGGAAVRIQPGEPTAIASDGKTTLVVRGGQWVPAQR